MAKKEERGFKYQKRDRDTLKERANMKGGNFDTIFKGSFKQWKPKDGKNIIRILPPTWDDARHYGLDIYINYNIGPDNQSYLSLSKHGRGDDPLAEARREAQREGDKELTKALSPNQRILYWIIDRNDEDEGPLLWASPFTFDKSLANLCIDEDTKEVIMIDDPEKGRDVRFYKEGTGMLTKYDPSKMKVLGPSPIADDEGLENEWLDFIADNPLPEVLNFYDYDHIKATFDGQIGKRDEDDAEKPEKSVKRRDRDEDGPVTKPARARSRPEPEDEDEEVPVRGNRKLQAPVEEEEAPPLRRRTRSEPEEDETPPPRARTRARPEPEPEEDDEPELPLKSRRGRSEPEEETGGSLRERIARRRRPDSDDD